MTVLFFDLDGTLTDPKAGITRSIQYALERLGRPVPAEDDLTWCIGPPLHGSFKTLVGEEQALEALRLYRERFSDIGLYENAVYEGIPETLAALAVRGRPLFVTTSKPTVYAERILDHFQLSSHFDVIFGSELDGRRADKTDLLGHVLEVTKVDPADGAMIGDREHDMVGARHHGLGAWGVLYGYGGREELTRAGAHHLVERPRDLLKMC